MPDLDTGQLHELVPLSSSLGMRVLTARADAVCLEMDWREDLCTAGGVLHGGALMALADTAGALCAFLNLAADSNGTTTVSSSTNLLAAVREGAVTADTVPVRAGKSLIVVETAVRDREGGLVSKTVQTQMVLRA
jgi:uncharacterized protein (TIGR00369 family)